MASDYQSRSILESRLKLGQTLSRATSGPAVSNPAVYDSLRQVSRSRVASILQQLRAAGGLSYAQVQTDTGLSQQIIFDVEYSERRLTLQELTLLAECYGASVNDILGVDIV